MQKKIQKFLKTQLSEINKLSNDDDDEIEAKLTLEENFEKYKESVDVSGNGDGEIDESRFGYAEEVQQSNNNFDVSRKRKKRGTQ